MSTIKTNTKSPKDTPLTAYLATIGAKLVDFSGWNMAVNFPLGIKQEHLWTRQHAGLFDVSHMGQIEIRGDNVAEKLEQLLPCDVINLEQGKARYSQLTNAEGGILDDLIISNAGEHFYMVVNASMFEQDYQYLTQSLPDLNFTSRDDCALIALQGPMAESIMQQFSSEACELKFMQTMLTSISGVECRVSRLGYTGEDGFEIAIPQQHAVDIAKQLIAHPECEPIGLGARDSLRLEAGLCLYGNDIDAKRSPVEAGLIWSIQKRRREQGGFKGSKRILNEIEQGAKQKLVGILPNSKMPARQGCEILDTNEKVIGMVTSGGFGPSCDSPISMGYVDSEYANENIEILLQVRNKKIPATIVSLPFVAQNYKR